jgi:hypothetical protein
MEHQDRKGIKERRMEASQLINDVKMVADDMVGAVLDELGRRNGRGMEMKEAWKASVDLLPKELPYPGAGEGEGEGDSAELHPPYLWTGENMNPPILAELLFGKGTKFDGRGGKGASMVEEEGQGGEDSGSDVEGDRKRKGKGSSKAGKKYSASGRKQRFEEGCAEVKRLFKENADLDIDYLRTPPKRKVKGLEIHATQARFRDGRVIPFYCMRCCDKNKGEYIAVARAKVKVVDDGEIEGNKFYYLELMDVFFHEVNCGGRKKCDSDDEGWEIVKRPNGKLIESIREEAFKGWIEHMHRYKFPWEEGRSSKRDGRKKLKGMPPGGEAIAFGAEEGEEDREPDIRRQIAIKKPKDIPGVIKKVQFTQYVAWNIYNIMNERGLVGEFTRYIPHPNPVHIRSRIIGAGQYPLVEGARRPIHLYVRGLFLLYGGMQAKVDMDAGEECIHQAAHSDFSNGFFQSVDDCPFAEWA